MTDLFHTPDFRPLLASVLAAPRDDAPRLVLADYAQECGMIEWAEFVRWQVQNRREAADAGHHFGTYHSSCNGVHGEWFSGHAAEVTSGFPEAWTWTWHRGFVARLRMPADDAFDRLGGLLENWPITTVVLTHRLSDDRADALRNRFLTQPARHRPKTLGAKLFHFFGGRVRFREDYDYPRPFETHPQLGGDVLLDPDDLREQVERLQNGLSRLLMGRGEWRRTARDGASTFSGRMVSSDVFARLLDAMRPEGSR